MRKRTKTKEQKVGVDLLIRGELILVLEEEPDENPPEDADRTLLCVRRKTNTTIPYRKNKRRKYQSDGRFRITSVNILVER